MKKQILSFSILISAMVFSLILVHGVAAQNNATSVDALSKITYPIAELGNCADQASCKTYCDKTENVNACLSFAEQRNLMSSEELSNAKKFQDVGMAGPGACVGKDACEQYCSNSTHLEECTAFAEKNGMMSDQQLQDSKKVVAAIKSGLKPPACSGPEKCNAYCSSSEHMQECMTFSIAAGIVPDSQKEQMQKTLDAFKQGIKPPACRPNPPSQSGQPAQPNQSNQSSQSLQDGLQSCDQYCADSSHVEECVKFSVAIGNMTEAQGQNSIKNGNKGPGGCVGKDACDTFCGNPDNQDACFNFAKDNGMISPEDLQKIQQGPGQGGSLKPGGQGQGDFNSQSNNQQIMPWADMCKPDANGKPMALACVDDAGNFVVSAKVGTDGQPVCPSGSTAKCGDYEQQNQQGQQSGPQVNPNQPGQNQQGPQGNPNQPGQGGPGQSGPAGGPNQGQGFNPGSGVNGNGNGPGGPGGCKGQAACQAYCASHQEECKNFQPPQGQQGQQGQPGQMQPQQPQQPQEQQQPPQSTSNGGPGNAWQGFTSLFR